MNRHLGPFVEGFTFAITILGGALLALALLVYLLTHPETIIAVVAGAAISWMMATGRMVPKSALDAERERADDLGRVLDEYLRNTGREGDA